MAGNQAIYLETGGYRNDLTTDNPILAAHFFTGPYLPCGISLINGVIASCSRVNNTCEVCKQN